MTTFLELRWTLHERQKDRRFLLPMGSHHFDHHQCTGIHIVTVTRNAAIEYIFSSDKTDNDKININEIPIVFNPYKNYFGHHRMSRLFSFAFICWKYPLVYKCSPLFSSQSLMLSFDGAKWGGHVNVLLNSQTVATCYLIGWVSRMDDQILYQRHPT